MKKNMGKQLQTKLGRISSTVLRVLYAPVRFSKKLVKQCDRGLKRSTIAVVRALYNAKWLRWARPFIRRVGKFSIHHYRIQAFGLFLLMAIAVVIPVYGEYNRAQRYVMTDQAKILVGDTNENLSKKLTFNNETQTYQFNQEGQKTAAPSESTGNEQADVASMLAQQMKQQAGGEGEDDEQLYSLDVPRDLSEGIVYYENNRGISFRLVPEFETMPGEVHDGYMIFPLNNGTKGQVVYTLKGGGLKEDLVLYEHPGVNELTMSYKLVLSDGTEARVIPESGEIGIYTASPELYGDISYSSDQDRELMINARKKAPKEYLAFSVPAPIVSRLDGGARTVSELTSRFLLSEDGTRLSVTTSGFGQVSQYPISIDPTVLTNSSSGLETGEAQDGNLDMTGGIATREGLTGGEVNTWSTTTAFTTARTGHETVVYRDYMYILGGLTGASTYANDVQYAAINSNGTLGTWTATSAFTTARAGHTAVAYNGYMYVIGGETAASTYTNDVQYAAINSNGTLGTWTATTALPVARAEHASTIYNGYIYISGGLTTNAMLFTSVNGNGGIGNWIDTTAMPSNRYNHSLVAYKDYMYLLSGQSSSGTYVSGSRYAYINSDGSLGNTWNTGTTFVNSRANYSAVAMGGYLYLIAGNFSTTYYSDVQYAPIYDNGSLGTWVTTASLSGGVAKQTSVISGNYIYAIGGNDASNSYDTVRYASVKALGGMSSYVADDAAYSATAQYGHASVVYKGYLYVIGGKKSSGSNGGRIDTIFYAPILTDGTVGTWTTNAVLLPAARLHVAAVAYNGYLYIAGGGTGSSDTAVADLDYAPINSNGSIGTFVTTTTDFTTARYGGSVLVYNNRLYVMPGKTGSGTYTDTIRWASINTNGSLGSWDNTETANATAFYGSAVYAGYMYIIGGENSFSTNYRYASIASDGSINTWTTSGTITSRVASRAIAYNGYMYMIGDSGGGAALYAQINSNGSLGSWQTGSAQAGTRYYLGAAMYKGILYITNGTSTASDYFSDVQMSQLNVDGMGATPSWTTSTSMTTGRSRHAAVIYNGILYSIGGISSFSNETASVEFIDINTATGSVGSIVRTTTSLPSIMYGMTAVAHNGYMYVIGGAAYDEDVTLTWTYYDTVLYAPIYANGSLGAWTSTTALPSARFGHTSVLYGGYIYAFGGQTSFNTYTSGVASAPINSNGSLGAWTSTTALPSAKFGHTSALNNGYVYAVGGMSDLTTYTNDVQYAPINTNGTIGTWNPTTYFELGRAYHASVALGGYLYITGGTDGTERSDVQYAPITADGTLGNWSYANTMISARSGHSLVVTDVGTMVTTGDDPAGTVVNYVAPATIGRTARYSKVVDLGISGSNNGPGTTGVFTNTSTLSTGRQGAATVAYNGYLYALGGKSGASTFIADVSYAPINANGSIGSWSATTAFTTGRAGHAAAAYNGYMYVIGGQTGTSTLTNTTYYAPINSDGTIGTWSSTATIASARGGIKAVVYNGRIYIVGGYDGTNYQTGAYIATPAADGTIAIWATGSASLPAGRSQYGLLAYNSVLYVVGGLHSTGARDTIYATSINPNGTLGDQWATATLPAARYGLEVVVYAGYMYMIGGIDASSTIYDTVQYAPISSNGGVGSWQSARSFTTARTDAGATVVNGKLYIVGGYDGTSVYLGDSQYAEISSGHGATLRGVSVTGVVPNESVNVLWRVGGIDTRMSGVRSYTDLPAATANVCTLEYGTRYVYFDVVLDDTNTSVIGDTGTKSHLDSITATFDVGKHAAPQNRLRGGKSFSNQTLLPIDTCEGVI